MAEATQTTKKLTHWPRTAKGSGKKACTVEGCKRPYRAKSYCFFHFKKWRQGDLPHSRYRVCSKAECRTKTMKGGMCEKHYNETYKKEAAA
ncbi:vegetative protein [Corallococcus sp. H22C18031201]|uniref:vegetative protein n=1 Tax=Citreicoccus inhibens TaxID=2849499 RepID=UPI000E75FC6A|nr:vegetative protein [Citreicoccus inhibens]MBU8897681.1 vegetative protein [Citreicoccus inhibens]RJS27454.1 vegetative protein [Corallococcus sp. H22C18031201]